MSSDTLRKAKSLKNDEFYTQFHDIQNEVNAYIEYNPNIFKGKTILCPCDDPSWSNFTLFFAQNFERFGIKKLICTSYAFASKNIFCEYEPSEQEQKSPKYDYEKSRTKGKKYTLDHDITGDGKINIEDIDWDYMDGDGDFRSDEVKNLLKEVDMIITNPPFSLFREFVAWIMENKKKFLIIGNVGAIGYKEIFSLIKDNKIWLGKGFANGNAFFRPLNTTDYAQGVYDEKTGLVKFRNCCWFTNLEHNRRHEPLKLKTMAENIKYNKKLKGENYQKYDNYDAIEVPEVKAIPSDYKGVMGVPTTFLNLYCPEQFEILGICENLNLYNLKTRIYSSQECKEAYFAKFNKKGTYDLNASGVIIIDGQFNKVYQRILIRHKSQ